MSNEGASANGWTADVLDALEAQQAELGSLLEGRTAAAWTAPSRCAGWSVKDVVAHVAQTNEMAVASVAGDLTGALDRLAEGLGPGSVDGPEPGPTSVDEGADAMVRLEHSTPAEEVHRRWASSAEAQILAFRGCDPHARLDWIAGQLAARTLATTRLAETWIHTCDIAVADGVVLEPTDRLRHVARLAWRTLPHAFTINQLTLSGPVAFNLDAPDGSIWVFEPNGRAATTISGSAIDLCEVAARRVDAASTSLTGSGPDVAAVLAVVRTWA